MTRPSHYARRARALALVSVLLATGALAQESWLDPVRRLDAQGRTREALGRLETEPGRLAGDTEARLLRGVLLAKLGRTGEARELYQRLILEQPDLPEAYNNLAVMHAAAGDYDTAIEILKRGLATHPSYRTTYDNLTKVYGKLAGEAYSKALGDERIDAEPLRLALINGLVEGADDAAPAPQRLAPAPAAAAHVVPAPTALESPTTPQPAREDGETEREIWQAVQSWADAWASQRADLYLSYYDRRFVPPRGSSRSDWESLRRHRLAAPEFIRISLALLEVERPAPDRAVAHFVQSYESDRYRDTVTKTLEMVPTEAGWRIVGERVEGESSG
ncbi:MAG: tetratricopeptide repeat protein [Thermoanaerobaculia bacterium]